MKAKATRCAIYTRKSSEEGLEQEFNSLHAQREACESYIASQKHEGWTAVKAVYDDGGFSGGSMKRPALTALIADIKEGKIDSVVVYKIDRLTRSLMDFAKLVEVFDAHNVTFVSVTQSFNTTTSMGRLTLNVLLSFAQFEREVTGERIRDKIAASRRKGMWMGGGIPAGYDLEGRQLVVNPHDAATIRLVFDLYLAHGSVRAVDAVLKQNNAVSPQRVSKTGHVSGNKPYSRGNLYRILRNPVYAGKVRHNDNLYDGSHEAIVSIDTWDQVQTRLDAGDTGEGSGATAIPAVKTIGRTSLLKGKLFDPDGVPYTPTYTKKGTTRYRYYLSQNLLHYKDHPKGLIARIPAPEIEDATIRLLRERLNDHRYLQDLWPTDHGSIGHMQRHFTMLDELALIRLVRKVIIHPDSLTIMLAEDLVHLHVRNRLSIELPEACPDRMSVSIPYGTRRGRDGAIIIEPQRKNKDRLDLPNEQLKKLVRGMIWREQHFSGTPLQQIARANDCSWTYVNNCIDYSFRF